MKTPIVLLMVIALFQLIYADGTPAVGSGTELDPYQISSIDNLLWLSTTESVWDNSYYFLQTQDIDARDTYNWNEGNGFSPIGMNEDNPFNGVYNGDNHIIDGLYINRSNAENIGLFGYTLGAAIASLGVINMNVTGNYNVGGLVGKNSDSEIIASYTTGSVTGVHKVGGLAGWSYQNSLISDSYAIVSVTGGSISGGLVGHNLDSSSISRSYAAGSVSGVNYIGGLVGLNGESPISDSYSTCIVTGNHYIGGLLGENEDNSTISNSYARGSVTGDYAYGGLVGKNNTSQILNCIWNIETSGLTSGIGNEDGGVITNLLGKTTAEMQIISTYTDIGWDFLGEVINGTEDIWEINDMYNFTYPYISALEYSLYDDLTANFSANTIFGSVPLTVNFIDYTVSQSSNVISWEWDFQDDGVIDSYEQYPVWEYTEQGNYSVRLTVCDDVTRNTSTVVKEDYITVYCETIQPQGDGTETNPYLVENINNLLWISTNDSCWSSYFLQIEDIDASDTKNWNAGYGLSPIGSEWQLFQGTYIGGDHIIDKLYINRPDYSSIGLFGCISGATIEALGVTNINVTGDYSVGGLVGHISESTISECYSSGRITGIGTTGGLIGGGIESTVINCYASGNVISNERAGGLMGSASHTTIFRCYFSRSVSGDGVGGLVGHTYYSTISKSYASVHANGDINVGGLVGSNSASTISESYATGIVNGNLRVGGLVGINAGSTISDCYATCTCSGNNYIGGLAGDNINGSTIDDCYTTGTETGNNYVAGFAGRNWEAQISNCIWNQELSTLTLAVGEEVGGTITNLLGKTTAEMHNMSTYTDIGWDFIGEIINGEQDIWDINDNINDGYPFIYDIEIPVGDDDDEIIENTSLEMINYPNPFNPETQIVFDLPEAGNTKLAVYNMKGQLVRVLADEKLPVGENMIVWDGRNDSGKKVSSGIYLLRLKSNNETATKKIMLIK